MYIKSNKSPEDYLADIRQVLIEQFNITDADIISIMHESDSYCIETFNIKIVSFIKALLYIESKLTRVIKDLYLIIKHYMRDNLGDSDSVSDDEEVNRALYNSKINIRTQLQNESIPKLTYDNITILTLKNLNTNNYNMIEEIDISIDNDFMIAIIQQLLRVSDILKSIVLHYPNNLVLESCKPFRKISIRNAITHIIIRDMPNLEELDLCNINNVTIENCPKLHKLHILNVRSYNISDEIYKNIRYLYIALSPNNSTMLSNFINLDRLSICNIDSLNKFVILPKQVKYIEICNEHTLILDIPVDNIIEKFSIIGCNHILDTVDIRLTNKLHERCIVTHNISSNLEIK
jgi:hypothetical protein